MGSYRLNVDLSVVKVPKTNTFVVFREKVSVIKILVK